MEISKMDFKTYLINKKIDPAEFRSSESETYQAFEALFNEMHPDSFTAQKLFLINKLRRAYQLKKSPNETTVNRPKKVKPKIVPKVAKPRKNKE